MNFALSLNHLHYRYQQNTVLDGISTTFTGTGITGLLGLNGQGKSTLLKVIAGILPVDRNQLTIEHQTSQTNPIGFLPERPLFYAELTIRENMQFAADLQGVVSDRRTASIERTLRQCQLEEHQNKLASSLSKGFQQRLGLAMAIVHQPRLLLLDEPTDGLDPQQITESHQLITTLSQHCHVLVSSHRLHEIEQLCSRVLVLHQGKLATDTLTSDSLTNNQSSQGHEDIAALFRRITEERADA